MITKTSFAPAPHAQTVETRPISPPSLGPGKEAKVECEDFHWDSAVFMYKISFLHQPDVHCSDRPFITMSVC